MAYEQHWLNPIGHLWGCPVTCLFLVFPLEQPISIWALLSPGPPSSQRGEEWRAHVVHSAVVPREFPSQIFLHITSKLKEAQKDPLDRIREATCKRMMSGYSLSCVFSQESDRENGKVSTRTTTESGGSLFPGDCLSRGWKSLDLESGVNSRADQCLWLSLVLRNEKR